jgi:hypothetical protein
MVGKPKPGGKTSHGPASRGARDAPGPPALGAPGPPALGAPGLPALGAPDGPGLPALGAPDGPGPPGTDPMRRAHPYPVRATHASPLHVPDNQYHAVGSHVLADPRRPWRPGGNPRRLAPHRPLPPWTQRPETKSLPANGGNCPTVSVRSRCGAPVAACPHPDPRPPGEGAAARPVSVAASARSVPPRFALLQRGRTKRGGHQTGGCWPGRWTRPQGWVPSLERGSGQAAARRAGLFDRLPVSSIILMWRDPHVALPGPDERCA